MAFLLPTTLKRSPPPKVVRRQEKYLQTENRQSLLRQLFTSPCRRGADSGISLVARRRLL
jgi:hypothetical protein